MEEGVTKSNKYVIGDNNLYIHLYMHEQIKYKDI